MTFPLAMGHAQRRVADLLRLLAEDRPQEALLGSQLGLALGSGLTHQDVAGLHIGTDPDDPAFVQLALGLVGQVRDVPVISSGPGGVAGVHFVFFDVDAGQHVVTHEALRTG